MGTFEGQMILITGAAGGLGAAVVRAFAREGGYVVATDLTEDLCLPLVREFDGNVRAAALDVTSEDSWVQVMDSVTGARRLDVLVNNAGFFKPNIPFEDMPLDLWRRHFAINSDGVFLGCKHAILRMKDNGGAIVNIASGSGVRPMPTSSAYCAAKAAVLMTTRTAAAAAGRYNIRVNSVLPGPVQTAMLMGNVIEGESPDEFLTAMAELGALGRMATPADIARSVLFLADPANSAVTGASIAADGGMLV